MKRLTIAALCAATMFGAPLLASGAAFAQDGGRWERGGGRGDGGGRGEGRRGDGGGRGEGGGQRQGGGDGGQQWRGRQGGDGGGGQRQGGDGGQQWRGRQGGDGGGGEAWRNRAQAQQGGGEPQWRPPQQRDGGGQGQRNRYASPDGQPRVQGAPDRRGRFVPGDQGGGDGSQAWRERRAAEGGQRPPRVQGAPSPEWRQRQGGGEQGYRRRGPENAPALEGGPRPDTRQAGPDERWRRQGDQQRNWQGGNNSRPGFAGAPNNGGDRYRGNDGPRRDGWNGGNNSRPNYAGRPNGGDNRYRGDGRRYDGDRRGPSRAYTQLRPRTHSYRNWQSVPRGRYFDRGYASVIGGYYGHHYRWWGEPGWRAPYRPWRVGYYLPRHLSYSPIPYDLYRRLPPPPYGCRYVRYGNDVLLIVISSLMVLDAIVWLDDGDYYGYDDGYYDGGYQDDRYDDEYYYDY